MVWLFEAGLPNDMQDLDCVTTFVYQITFVKTQPNGTHT